MALRVRRTGFGHGCGRAVINRYRGYWDANPATLIPLSPEDSAPLYVEIIGGAAKIMARGKELYEQGRYRYAQEILNKLVYAEPGNKEAKDRQPRRLRAAQVAAGAF